MSFTNTDTIAIKIQSTSSNEQGAKRKELDPKQNFEYDFEEEDPDGTKYTNKILSRARRAWKRAILEEIEWQR